MANQSYMQTSYLFLTKSRINRLGIFQHIPFSATILPLLFTLDGNAIFLCQIAMRSSLHILYISWWVLVTRNGIAKQMYLIWTVSQKIYNKMVPQLCIVFPWDVLLMSEDSAVYSICYRAQMDASHPTSQACFWQTHHTIVCQLGQDPSWSK